MSEQHSAGTWIQVAAGLKNPQMRRVLGQVLAGGTAEIDARAKQTAKALQRWADIGLLAQNEAGTWQVNEQLLSDTLSAAGEAKADRSGILRFFDGPQLHTLPSKPADRREVLLYVRNAVIAPGQTLREDQLNERIIVFHPDTALIRRYLVDHGLLLRTADGSSYQLGSD
ncbi:DUF2087 domain-containing protein [Glutamicibacter sp.]|uniref:DUF2087 domain-containing protein n=1 Tax=Glutamicibacter sp. TaxID=1931995 RepID=UPI0028BDDEFA|nr:DUF2087 domain-containing protein [Glutamicibacter sp.]